MIQQVRALCQIHQKNKDRPRLLIVGMPPWASSHMVHMKAQQKGSAPVVPDEPLLPVKPVAPVVPVAPAVPVAPVSPELPENKGTML